MASFPGWRPFCDLEWLEWRCAHWPFEIRAPGEECAAASLGLFHTGCVVFFTQRCTRNGKFQQ